jgi:adenylate cyclase
MPGQTSGCVMFADVSGSTKLYEAVGDATAHAAIDLCVKLFSALTVQHGGRVIKTIGDEVMAIFPAADRAGNAAVDIQLAVNDMAPVEKVRLGVRIGLHHGAVVERDGDVFGDTVNLAARLTELASRGQIITSQETVDGFEPMRRLDCRRLYAIPVKGKEHDVNLWEVLWADTDDATQMATQRIRGKRDPGTLRLVYNGRTVTLPGDRRSVVMGRDATADLVVAERMASRLHCEVEQRQDKFFISDRSANGTFVTIEGDREMTLRREESMLRGRGVITLGQSRTTATEIVEFICD